MHVCLSCIEFFGPGIQGGFARATRFLGRELVRRGVRVTVVVPRRGQLQEGTIDGMEVRGFNPLWPGSAVAAFRACGADVYHSQDTSLGTWFARLAMPNARHAVTFRDPLEAADWQVETRLSGKNRLAYLTYRYFIDNPLAAWAVRRADAHFCAARFLAAKVTRKYGAGVRPEFLPTPVDVPDRIEKSPHPTVIFVSRWDPRKRPEQFFELARRFPEVNFVAVGGSSDLERDTRLREFGQAIPNLELPGIIDQFADDRLSRMLARSWILVNASPREGLPNAFLEAAAHRCALLSYADPDQFASRFGRRAEAGGLAEGLAWLLEANRWREQGEAGYAFVREVFATPVAVEAHMAAYQRLLQARRP